MALGVIVFGPLGRYLPVAAWQATPLWRKYSVYGGMLTGLGAIVLLVLVSQFAISKYWAGLVVAPAIMAVVSYFVHRFLTSVT